MDVKKGVRFLCWTVCLDANPYNNHKHHMCIEWMLFGPLVTFVYQKFSSGMAILLLLFVDRK